jgi:ATP-dependent protease ClpP protease subunit
MRIDIKGTIVSNDDAWIYDWYDIENTSPKSVIDNITAANGEDIELVINSGGGDVYAATEIYAALKEYSGNITGKIISIAASAASVIAMGAKKLMMSPAAQLMIHNVSSFGMGDHRDMDHEAEVLRSHDNAIANTYVVKTGMELKEVLKLMGNETYMSAQEALKNKFVDEIMFNESNRITASLAQVLPVEVINKTRAMKNNELAAKKAAEVLPEDFQADLVNLYQTKILINRRKNNV